MIKKIGVLTSGGDAPGMNAAVRSITRYAIHNGIDVEGIHRGYEGLLLEDTEPLFRRTVGGMIHRGGTMLRTARSLEFKQPSAQLKAIGFMHKIGIEALVVIGGDGSMAGAQCLSKLGFPTVTLPGTIDNDMAGTQYTIGFDTTLNTILDAVNKIRDTANSHGRVAIVEVMGRCAGFIALHAGLACGAEFALLPEKPVSLEDLCMSLSDSHKDGKLSSIVIVAEGAPVDGRAVMSYIKEHTYLEPNLTVLGYLQRGGAPSAKDSIMASLMAEKAVQSIMEGQYDVLVGAIDGKIVATPYADASKMKFRIDENMYQLLNILGA